MGEVLRPREGERLSSAARTTRPNNRRSPPSDNHWSRLTRITHNPAGQASPGGRRPPCPRTGVTAAGSARWGPRSSRGPTGCRGTGNGPSVADRGAFSPSAQGASLLASNGRVTPQRPAGPARRRWVHRKGGAKPWIEGQNPTEHRPRLTRSNSGRDYQVLAKRGRNGIDEPFDPSNPATPNSGRNDRNRARKRGWFRTGPAPAPGGRRSPADHRRRPPRTAPAVVRVRRHGRRPRCAPPSR